MKCSTGNTRNIPVKPGIVKNNNNFGADYGMSLQPDSLNPLLYKALKSTTVELGGKKQLTFTSFGLSL